MWKMFTRLPQQHLEIDDEMLYIMIRFSRYKCAFKVVLVKTFLSVNNSRTKTCNLQCIYEFLVPCSYSGSFSKCVIFSQNVMDLTVKIDWIFFLMQSNARRGGPVRCSPYGSQKTLALLKRRESWLSVVNAF